MKKQILCVAVISAFLAGCSYNGTVATYSLVSTYNFSSPQRVKVSAEGCDNRSVKNMYDMERNTNAITSALNRAKREGKPSDALLNPSFVSKDGLGWSSQCATFTGTPVGVRLIK